MPSDIIVSSRDIVCLVGGAAIDPDDIAAVLPFVHKYIAVDAGADHLLAAGVAPAAVIGDLDSLSSHARATFADVLCHICEQSTTDFEKAVTRVSAPAMIALGFTGGRIDHALTALNVMARHPDKNIVLVDADDASFIAPQGRLTLHLPLDCRVSLMPLGQVRVSARGLRWSFDRADMHPTGFISPSNAVAADLVTVDTDGPLLVTLPRAQLEIVLLAVVRGQ